MLVGFRVFHSLMACNKTERRLLLPEPFRRALGHHDGAIVCGRSSATRRSHGTSQWSWMPDICSLRCDGTTQSSPVSLFPCVFYRLIFKDDTCAYACETNWDSSSESEAKASPALPRFPSLPATSAPSSSCSHLLSFPSQATESPIGLG